MTTGAILPLSAAGTNGSDTAARKTDSPEKIREAASQFEALLIASLMKTMRQSSGWLSTGEEDQSGMHAMEFAEEQMAQALASQGGIGLAGLVVEGLKKRPDAQP